MPARRGGNPPRNRLLSPPSPTGFGEDSSSIIDPAVERAESRGSPLGWSVQSGAMHDLRTSTALRQLADLDDGPNPPTWSWAVVALEPSGRVRLPTAACSALDAQLGDSVEVKGVCRRDVLVVRSAGAGRQLTIDGPPNIHQTSTRMSVIATPSLFARAVPGRGLTIQRKGQPNLTCPTASKRLIERTCSDLQ